MMENVTNIYDLRSTIKIVLRNKSVIDFLAEWELLLIGFEGIRNRVGENNFSLLS